MSVFKFLGFGDKSISSSIDDWHLPVYIDQRTDMKCKICGAEIATPPKDKKDSCCNKISCQEDFANWLDNTVTQDRSPIRVSTNVGNMP